MSSIESESTDGEIDAEAAAAGGSSVSPDDAELYYRKYRAVQVEANTVRDERDAAIRELVAERNAHAHTTGDAHGRRQHRHHEESMPDGDERKQVELLARKFCIMYSFWLRDVDTTFKTPVDPSYDPHQRFSSAATRIQGQLADIIHVLPKEYHTRIYLRPWTHTWNMAMQQQRSNSVSRVREMAMVIFNCTADEIATSAARLTTFKEKIGFSIGRDGIGYYKLMAPIIYKDYDGKHNIKTIFLNPVLFKVFSAVVLGPSSLKDVGAHGARGHSVYKLWKLRKITAGAIAASAILARFILSADTLLEPEGGETKIHYQDDFDGYLEYLVSGLRERAPSVMAIFAAWNKKFFPDADSVDDDTVSDVYTESPRSDSGRHNEDEDTLATVLAALREETLIASGSQPDQANTETPRPPEAHHLEGAEKRARDGSPENPENLAADISLPPPSKRIEIGESNIASSSTVAQANGATRVTKQKRRKRR